MEVITKICTKCKKEKSFEEFANNKRSKDGLQSWCKVCRKEYYEDNKKHIVKINKEYYENNKEKVAKKNKKYYENNKEKILENNKEYYENNKEKILENNKETQKKYYENNKEKVAKKNKKYYQTNPDKYFNYGVIRRQREKNAGDGITKEEWVEIMCSTNWSCFYCNTSLSKNNRTIDHIIPICRGGPHIKENLVPACKSCNSSKHNKIGNEWKYFNNLSQNKQEYIYKIIDKYK